MYQFIPFASYCMGKDFYHSPRRMFCQIQNGRMLWQITDLHAGQTACRTKYSFHGGFSGWLSRVQAYGSHFWMRDGKRGDLFLLYVVHYPRSQSEHQHTHRWPYGQHQGIQMLGDLQYSRDWACALLLGHTLPWWCIILAIMKCHLLNTQWDPDIVRIARNLLLRPVISIHSGSIIK